MKSLLLPFFAIPLFVGSAFAADLKLAGIFTDHSVLQRDQSAGVRFSWAQVPEVNLFNRNGLPAVPFTSR